MPETFAGWLHFALALAALAVAAVIFARAKGDAAHRMLGRLYLAAMIALNLAALTIHVDSGGPGVFHALALVSLATILAGWRAIRRIPRGASRRARHGALMSWSAAGLAAAGLGQVSVAFGIGPAPAILAGLGLAAWLIHGRGLVTRAARR